MSPCRSQLTMCPRGTTTNSHNHQCAPGASSFEPKGTMLRPLPAGLSPSLQLGKLCLLPTCSQRCGTLPGLRPSTAASCLPPPTAPRPGRGGSPGLGSWGQADPCTPGLDKEQGQPTGPWASLFHQHWTRAQSGVGLPSPGARALRQLWGTAWAPGLLDGSTPGPNRRVERPAGKEDRRRAAGTGWRCGRQVKAVSQGLSWALGLV